MWYHTLVHVVPRFGTSGTTLWYWWYHGLVLSWSICGCRMSLHEMELARKIVVSLKASMKDFCFCFNNLIISCLHDCERVKG